MAESRRPARDLTASLSFCTDDLRSGLELVHCWPERGDTLLREPVGDEAYIYPLTAWVQNDLQRLNYYALQYHEMARELTKLWIQHHRRQPENWIFVVGFLLRHTMELRLKAAISRTPPFTALDLAGQRKMLWVTHSIRDLWDQLEPVLPELSKQQAPLPRGLLYELDDLDRTSDGFRYPFRAEKTGARIEAEASLFRWRQTIRAMSQLTTSSGHSRNLQLAGYGSRCRGNRIKRPSRRA